MARRNSLLETLPSLPSFQWSHWRKRSVRRAACCTSASRSCSPTCGVRMMRAKGWSGGRWELRVGEGKEVGEA